MILQPPAGLYKALAAIGVWNIVEKLILPGIKSLYNHIMEKRDQSVWAIVREPKQKPLGTQGGKTFYDKHVEVPHTVPEIAKRIGRKESNVTSSLRRLEKRGKVKDVHGGWQRI